MQYVRSRNNPEISYFLTTNIFGEINLFNYQSPSSLSVSSYYLLLAMLSSLPLPIYVKADKEKEKPGKTFPKS